MVEATRPLIMLLEDLPTDVLTLVRDEFLHEDDRVAFESTSKALHDLGGRERPSVTPDKKERLRRLARDPRAPRLTLPWFQVRRCSIPSENNETFELTTHPFLLTETPVGLPLWRERPGVEVPLHHARGRPGKPRRPPLPAEEGVPL
uniref:F-box domain-containing protein n=1 Tax=Chloropicon roscoffensis TaxID=1461544 RepID=A0A7S3C6H4_9CHLO